MRVERPQLNQGTSFVGKLRLNSSWACFILTFADDLECYKENKMLMRACCRKGY